MPILAAVQKPPGPHPTISHHLADIKPTANPPMAAPRLGGCLQRLPQPSLCSLSPYTWFNQTVC